MPAESQLKRNEKISEMILDKDARYRILRIR